MAGFKAHVRTDISDRGYFRFRRTLVDYAHDGVRGLLASATFDPAGWHGVAASGEFYDDVAYDGTPDRPYRLVQCLNTGTYRLYAALQLPQDFGVFQDASHVGGLVSLKTYRSAAITSLTLTLSKGGVADATINAVSVSPTTLGTWEVFSFVPGTVYAKGDWLTLAVAFAADTVADAVRLAELSVDYVTGREHAAV